ncbi:MAG: hypothetical protein KC649_02875, partial [Candidatus Omnitrophica bacterium]|nr:hypothetical protein [Candidatus Omnitrophota bacterium]
LGTAGIEVDAEIQQLTAKTVTGLQTQAQLAFIESKNEKNQADTREQALEQTTDAVVSIARIEAARQSGVSEVASNRAAASSIIESAARIAGTDTAAAADIITAAAEALGESNEGAVQALLTMVEQAKKDQDSKKADESKEKDPVLAQLEAIMEAESGRKAASLEANIRSISQNAKFANAEGARIVGDTVVDKDGLTQAQNELLETLGDSINENNSPIQNIINVSRILNSESDQIQELTEADIDAFIDTVFPGLPFGARNQTLALISVAAEVAAALAGGSENLEGLKIEDLLAAAKEMRSENTISPIITLLRQKLGLEIDSAQFSAGFNKLKSDISAKVAQKQRIGKEDLIGLNQLFNNATGGSDAETASGQDLQLDTVNTSDAADTVTTTDAARARTTVRVSTAGEIPLVISNQAAEKGSLRSELLSSISSRTRGDEISQGAVEYMLSQRGLGSSFQTNRYDIYLGLLMDEQQVDALDSTTPGTRPVLKTASSGARYSDEEMVRVLRQADMYQDEQPALKQIRLGSNDKSPVYSIYLFDGPESDFSSARLGSYDRQDGFGSGYRVYVGEKDITRKMSESGISRDAAILSLAAHEAAEANLVLQSAAAHLDAEYKSAGINRAKLDLTKDEDQVIVRNALKDPKNVEWTTPLYTRTHEFGLSVEKAVGTAARLLGDSFRSDDISIQVSADNPTNAVITFDKQSVSAGITEQAGIEIQSIEVKAESGIEELSRATAELEKMDLKVTLNGRLNSRDVVDSYQTQFEIALAPTEELAVVDGILSTEDRVIGITTAGIRTQNVTIEEVGSTESTIALSRSLVQQGSAPAVIRTRIDSDTVIETITDGRFITNTIESGSVRVTLERNLITGSAASAVSRVAALVATIQTAKTAVLSQFNIDIDNTSIANGTGEAQQNARLAVIQFSDRVLSAAKQQNLSVESVSVQTVESSDSKTGFVITTVSDNDQPKTQIVAVRTAAGDVVNLNNALDLQAGISSAEENASDLQADIQRVTVFNRAVQSIVAAAAEITVSVRTLGDAIALIDAFAEFGIGVQIQTAEGTVIASSITETGERVISIISQVLSDGTVIPVNIQLPADEENRELVEQIIKSLVAVAGKSVRSDFITQDETLETNLRKAILENLINNGLNNIANQISVKGIDRSEER